MRKLAPLRGESVPKVWMFTDTETKVESVDGVNAHRFHMGWIFFCTPGWEKEEGEFSSHFFNKEREYLKFIEITARDHGSLTLCGHNIFFDLQAGGFFPYFKRRGWKLEYLYDKGMIFILKVVKDISSLTILSTTNWFDCSLRELGEMIGVSKQKVDFDSVSDLKLKEYCYRDTEIVMVAMRRYLSFIREHDLGSFRFTKSSQALTGFRKHFMTGNIYVHDDERVHALERAAYMGGRTEAYFIGDVRGRSFVTLDVNSMYPYVMKKYSYPSKLVGYLEGESDNKYTELLGSWLMIAQVEVETPEPVFAVRYRGKTVFPIGRFECYLCSEGIRYARDHGYIKRFIRAAVYLPADLFTWYVNYFRELRNGYLTDANPVMEKLCKYMHNSLYGKFGERDIVTDVYEGDRGFDYYREEVIDAVKGGVWIETYLMNSHLVQHYEGESSHSCPAIAAHITENARMALWNIMKSVGLKRVLYCDTDSIIIRETDLKRIKWVIDDQELGALKIQDWYKKLHIDGAKNYRTDQVRHIKGIPATAKEVAPGVFEYMHFSRMCMCLRERHDVGVPLEVQQRTLKTGYDKGIVTFSGKVEPLRFEPQRRPSSQLRLL
uniref:DNA-directed DNA polymerase n=1 Tax=viral metagenome TaxID=1070528 RepID=A0A6M3LGA9_9ZZZZ